MPGSLYIVATPIGNLEDITLRAIRKLGEVSLIAAEDTRHTQNLLNHFEIHRPLTSYHDFSKEQKAEVLVEKLLGGDDIALVSDAGTPGISDPGYYLINRCIEEGIAVVPIPGATAATTALSVSGLPTDSFAFEGFLPPKKMKRLARLTELKSEQRTLIFYEAPHRIEACLLDMLEALGDRRIVLARELTKIHEEFLRGKITDILEIVQTRKLKGEMTVLVEGMRHEPPEPSVLSIQDHVDNVIREDGVTKKEAIEKVAKLRGLPKKDVYNEVMRKD